MVGLPWLPCILMVSRDHCLHFVLLQTLPCLLRRCCRKLLVPLVPAQRLKQSISFCSCNVKLAVKASRLKCSCTPFSRRQLLEINLSTEFFDFLVFFLTAWHKKKPIRYCTGYGKRQKKRVIKRGIRNRKYLISAFSISTVSRGF